MKQIKQETGRSMVEMLGVLAVIGVLSVGGISGYTLAMNKHRANSVAADLMKRAVVISAQRQLGQEPNVDGFGNQVGDYSLDSNISKNDANQTFGMTVKDVPEEVCEKILALDWDNATIRPAKAEDCNGGDMTFTYKNDLSPVTGGEGTDTPQKPTCEEGSTGNGCQKCENGNMVPDTAKNDQACGVGVCTDGKCCQNGVCADSEERLYCEANYGYQYTGDATAPCDLYASCPKGYDVLDAQDNLGLGMCCNGKIYQHEYQGMQCCEAENRVEIKDGVGYCLAPEEHLFKRYAYNTGWEVCSSSEFRDALNDNISGECCTGGSVVAEVYYYADIAWLLCNDGPGKEREGYYDSATSTYVYCSNGVDKAYYQANESWRCLE